jgi:rhamnosyltransferase subunit B
VTDHGRERERRGRIVLATFGTLGDLYPTLGVALGLHERGHDVVVAANPFHREGVERLGLRFAPLRPDLPDWKSDSGVIDRMMDPRRGTVRVVREFILPRLSEQYDDMAAAAEGADLVVSSLLVFAARLAAERLGVDWASMTFQPAALLSVFDPPVVGVLPGQSLIKALGPNGARGALRLLRGLADRWMEPWRDFRAELGLPPTDVNPFFEGQHSPLLTLALFSPLLAPPQPDWPPSTVVTGFPFDDRIGWAGMSPEIERFLAAGPPPVVFTLGSSAVLSAGDFYRESLAALDRLGQRGILLVGPDPRNLRCRLPEGVIAAEYAPHSLVFPRAAAVVHQGGIGTTGQAMRAGKPMLVVPFAHDQPDNAARVRRLGIARVLPSRRYDGRRAAKALAALLEDERYRVRAAEVGAAVRAEAGVAVACDAIEAVLCGR